MRPLLFVDIDGVLNPYASDRCPSGYVEHDLFPSDDDPVRVCPEHTRLLGELSVVFDLVWASSWTEDERRALDTVLDLPAFSGAVSLPTGPFDPRDKVPAVAEFAGDRVLAWIDDLLAPEAFAWAQARRVPTLLVPLDPSIELTAEMTDHVLAWVQNLA